MKKIKTLHIEQIFDSLLDRLAKGKWPQNKPIQIYPLQQVAPFLNTPSATYRAGFNKLIFLENGSIRQIIDGTENILNDRSLLFVKKGQVFSLESFGNITGGYIIFFSVEALAETIPPKHLSRVLEINPLLRLDEPSAAWIGNACRLLMIQFNTTPESSLPITGSLLATIMLKIIDLSSIDKNQWSRKEEVAYMFRRLVVERAVELPEVRSLADELHVSESYLYRCVKEITGRSPKQWLLDAALLNSRSLLREGKLSIMQVSRESGFADPSYFGRLFKKRFGLTPRDYQQEVK